MPFGCTFAPYRLFSLYQTHELQHSFGGSISSFEHVTWPVCLILCQHFCQTNGNRNLIHATSQTGHCRISFATFRRARNRFASLESTVVPRSSSIDLSVIDRSYETHEGNTKRIATFPTMYAFANSISNRVDLSPTSIVNYRNTVPRARVRIHNDFKDFVPLLLLRSSLFYLRTR